MTEPNPAPDLLETVARLAAEAAVAALPDYGAAVAALEKKLAELEAADAPYPDPTPALEALADQIADLKLSELERNAG